MIGASSGSGTGRCRGGRRCCCGGAGVAADTWVALDGAQIRDIYPAVCETFAQELRILLAVQFAADRACR